MENVLASQIFLLSHQKFQVRLVLQKGEMFPSKIQNKSYPFEKKALKDEIMYFFLKYHDGDDVIYSVVSRSWAILWAKSLHNLSSSMLWQASASVVASHHVL